MTTPTQDPIVVYVGDDWLFPITLKDDDGNAINLTGSTPGGEFWRVGDQAPASDLPVGIALGDPTSGIALADPTSGSFVVKIHRELTTTVAAQTPAAKGYPTRIQIYVDDALGNRRTYAIIPILPLAPRSA